MTTKRALISVSDKSGIVDFAQELKNLGWEIVSTGGTKVALDKAGIDTIAIDDVTGFPEMMDGRVKTLHPNIHGGLLARRDLDSHVNARKEHGITPMSTFTHSRRLFLNQMRPMRMRLKILISADHLCCAQQLKTMPV